MREAAKAADIWDSAPHLQSIKQAAMKRFYDTVYIYTCIYNYNYIVVLFVFPGLYIMS